MTEITLLQKEDEEEYETVLKTNEHALLYGSIKYRNLLRQVVDGEDYYLVAKQDGRIVGMFPAFLECNSKYGNILNSLPFYGSNGGTTCSSSLSDPQSVKHQLLDAFHDLAREKEAILSTIITSPFEENIDVYEEYAGHDYQDSRIGQVTTLPVTNENVDSALMAMFDSVRRRNIRKAYRESIQHRHSAKIEDLRFLAKAHKQNIEAIGGLAKSWDFFGFIPEVFTYDADYRVYIAELDDKRIGALLVFYYHRTVEYYCPAILHEYRSLQSNSLLIFEAMKDAAQRGYRYWNWGGTWPSQKSLYNFKKRWGAEDFPYNYYVTTYRDVSHIKSLEKSELLKEYPYFYVIPFSEWEVTP